MKIRTVLSAYLVLILLTACIPTASQVSEAIAKTQTAWTPIPTYTALPTYTPFLPITVEVTRIVIVTPTFTLTKTPIIPLVSITPSPPLPPPIPPLLFTDKFKPVGCINELENGQVSTYYTRLSGEMSSLALSPDGVLYFSANDFYITKFQNGLEIQVYTHDADIDDIGFDSEGRLYFSEATGAGGDGFIYRLDDSQATEFYRVKLSQVDGFWVGNFAFDDADNLWLSSGNQIPAYLYEIVDGVPKQMYMFASESISGFSFEPGGSVIFVNFQNRIYRLNLTPPGYIQEIYTDLSAEHLSDVILNLP